MKFENRTLLELRVGKTHLIEVLVYLRSEDVVWWNEDLSSHRTQLLEIISKRVLPIELKENTHVRKRRLEEVGSDIRSMEGDNASSHVVGEKFSGAIATRKGKRKRGFMRKRGGVKGGKSVNTTLDYENYDAAGSNGINKDSREKHNGDKSKRGQGDSGKSSLLNKASSSLSSETNVTFLFGKSIQITYMMEDISKSLGATLVFSKIKKNMPNVSNASRKKNLPNLIELIKYPKRIVLWCYPFDPNNPTKPITHGGGFPRPEMIPMISLFSEGPTHNRSS
eukprot:CAMPEP_0184858972 /NCGR_PEP_ID=MMETSP0580-20130426/3996_1 /TAXON_ID=1118495 /ORGANISM="Dactyliosolen fragilissimus" /LENGTH=279 /DNA_ID=CAMNT_0027355357 /DNA_START=62 /DNA_END=901 /DNA_ORIENTATION=+